MIRARSRRRVAGAVAVIGLVAAVALVAVALPAPRRDRGPDTKVIVSAAPGPVIPAGFVGLSLEYPALSAYAGTNPGDLDPSLARLIDNLAPGQSPVLRVGGDSTDTTWWPAPGLRRPPGMRLALTPAWLSVLRELAARAHARLIMGIDLEAGRPALAVAEARALLRGLGAGRLEAFEIGNEPGRYRMFAWYHTAGGQPIFARSPSYGPAAFTREFAAVGALLPPGVPLAGPAFGGPDWMRYLGAFLAAAPRLGLVTYHRYPLDRCLTPRSSRYYPTLRSLLSTAASRGLAAGLGGYVATARRHRLALRIDEINSVACGGRYGVSNVFASSLWALDALFAIARSGAQGVNLHSFPAASYAPFSARLVGGRWRVRPNPEYFGLEMFARAAPPGARLLSAVSTDLSAVRAWATRTADGTVRVVLINDDLHHSHLVSVRPPARGGAATVLRLTAPSAAATRRIGLGGHGVLRPRASGTYDVALPAASAALVTISP